MNFAKYNFFIFLLKPICAQWVEPGEISIGPDIIRSDYVYREDFGTIETSSPYTSNNVVHYHIYSKKVCLLRVFHYCHWKSGLRHFQPLEYRFTKFQLEKLDDKCQDYVVLKLNGYETEKLCGGRDENETGFWQPTFGRNIELIFSTDLSVNKRNSFQHEVRTQGSVVR